MNVVYVSNEAYAQHFAVSLASLCDCNPDEEELKIYLLDTGILPETAEKLKELAADFGRILTLIPCRNLEERFPERPDTGRFDLSTLGRFFLGELLPADVKRVLYLDCDTVVQRSLHRMYKSELGGKLLAMAEEPSIYHEVKAYLGILPLSGSGRHQRAPAGAHCRAASEVQFHHQLLLLLLRGARGLFACLPCNRGTAFPHGQALSGHSSLCGG